MTTQISDIKLVKVYGINVANMNYHSIPTDLPFVRQLTKSEYDSFEPFEKFSMISKQNRSLVRNRLICMPGIARIRSN